MQREQFQQLLKNYVEGNCTDQEKAIIEQWYELLEQENFQVPEEEEMTATEIRLWSKIQERNQRKETPVKRSKVVLMFSKWAAAAVIIGVIVLSFFLYRNSGNDKQQISIETNSADIKKSNISAAAIKISLEDGSVITLAPNSTLSYPRHFDKAKREVYIDGEAFFQVTKNPAQPFLVYCQNIVTRVVGTSFMVKKEAGEQVEVEVATGIVSVYERDKKYLQKTISNTSGVVLTANQKVTYYPANRHFITSLVDNPIPASTSLSPDSAKYENYFSFQDTPLSIVIKRLEEVYKIKFIIENENLLNCPFTGSIQDEDLYTKLQFICQATRTSYEIQGTQILIRGNGCN